MLGFLNRKFIFSVLSIFILIFIFFCFKFKIELSGEFAKAVEQTQFYFASLTILPEKNVEPTMETQNNNLTQEKEIENEVTKPILIEENNEEELDDLAEQVDLIKRKIDDLIEARKPKIVETEKQIDKEKKLEDKKVDEEKIADDKPKELEKPFYPQILLSEVQIADANSDKQEFVELYNPSEKAVDLTNWYLQRKTKNSESFSTFVSSSLFLNKIIYAKSYFLIARANSFFASYADVLTENPLTEDNVLVLKNPNKETSDLLGFGQANEFMGNVAENPPSGKTIGRKWVNNDEQNIGSNNLDFELQFSTPKQQNKKFIEIPAVGGGGGTGESVYYKILISEILLGSDEFIELYNPNNVNVSLDSWYLQRKTKSASEYSSYVTKTNFAGKTILANDYFLIARQGSQYEILSDMVFDEPLTADNSLILKNPKHEISDKLGFGQASDAETLPAIATEINKSLGRKVVENLEQDTDNNFTDFEVQTPTPKAKNVTFIEIPVIETPKDTTAPVVTFEAMPATQTSLNFSINFEISDLDLLGTVTPSGVDGFVFRWKEEGKEWQENEVENFLANPIKKDFTGEDQKNYYFQVKAKDKQGNWSEFLPIDPIFTKIELPPAPPAVDKTPPTGTIKINNSELYTNNRNVVLTISAQDDLSAVTEMKIANFTSYKDWESYATEKNWELPATNGLKTVRIKFKDSAGNETAVGIPVTITLDTVLPILTLNGEANVNLNVGDTYTELGATVFDLNIEVSAIIIGGDFVDTSKSGNYKVTYDATDKAGNKALQLSRIITVNEVVQEAPKLDI